MSYKAIVCTLEKVYSHPNANKIQLAKVFNIQIVVGLDQKVGDKGVYFPTDGQLSEKFCKENNLIGYKDLKTGEKKGGYFDHRRKVRTQSFRGEKSDGFWIPLKSLKFTGINVNSLNDGFQFNSINGVEICKKYITKATRNSLNNSKNKTRSKKKNNIMFKQHFDTDQYAYNKFKIPKGSLIHITEKCHGSSGRLGLFKKVRLLNKIQKFINKIIPLYCQDKWLYISGSRRVEIKLDDLENQKGYYGDNSFRKKWHDFFKGKLKKGETVYFEIVGWVNEDKTIMARCSNKKLKDKDFINQYGDETIFSYGCKQGCSDIYVYRITMTNEDGETVEYPWSAVKERCRELEVKHVPELVDSFIFDGNSENLDKIVEELKEGSSVIDSSHIKEGVVLRIENFGKNIYCLKDKSYNFKVLEGILKDNNVIDIEEIEDLKEN